MRWCLCGHYISVHHSTMGCLVEGCSCDRKRDVLSAPEPSARDRAIAELLEAAEEHRTAYLALSDELHALDATMDLPVTLDDKWGEATVTDLRLRTAIENVRKLEGK